MNRAAWSTAQAAGAGPVGSASPVQRLPRAHDATHDAARDAPDGWYRLWAIDRHPRAVLWAQATVGRALLVAAFAATAHAAGASWPYVLAAAAFAYLPAWRHWIAVLACAVAIARSAGGWLELLAPLRLHEGVSLPAARAAVGCALPAFMLATWALLAWVQRHPQAWLARRPVQGLLGLSFLLAALAGSPWLEGAMRQAAWALVGALTTGLWALAYAIADLRSRAPAPLAWQWSLLHPLWRSSVWSSSPTPFGKGAAFLRRHQATTAEELAVTQLKALKLMAWAAMLAGLQQVLTAIVQGRLGVVPTASAYAAFLQGRPLPVAASWASLAWATLGGALGFAAWGHKIIAVARLAGFRLPRNTWRPLQALTLAEFWNRYYFYFKELLVEFFFMPTFLRVLRRHPRLRVFFATFMAAGVGNALYHFLRDIHQVALAGWGQALAGFSSYGFYCAVLATGIGISQARLNAGRVLPQSWTGRLACALCVWFFFVCLQVFGDERRGFSLHDRLAFFFSLFGVA